MEKRKRKLAFDTYRGLQHEVGHAITEEEAKSLLMRYAPDIYETEFEKIPEA